MAGVDEGDVEFETARPCSLRRRPCCFRSACGGCNEQVRGDAVLHADNSSSVERRRGCSGGEEGRTGEEKDARQAGNDLFERAIILAAVVPWCRRCGPTDRRVQGSTDFRPQRPGAPRRAPRRPGNASRWAASRHAGVAASPAYLDLDFPPLAAKAAEKVAAVRSACTITWRIQIG